MANKKIEQMSKEELMEEYKKTLLFSGGEVSSTEEAQARAIVQLTESPDPEILTQLTDIEIKRLAVLSAIADLYHSDVIKKIIEKFIRLRISYNRKGREEIVEIAKKPKIEAPNQGLLRFGRV